MSKKYIAIDASTEACSVAIQIEDKIFSRFELCPQSHSLVLLPMIDELLAESKSQLKDFDALFFGRGPGSFTGVRIGIGVAQGLAYSSSLPLVGISTMQTMAQQAFDEKSQQQVVTAIDARMSEIYTGLYRVDDKGIMQEAVDEAVISPNDFSAHYPSSNELGYGVGTGWEAYKEALSLYRPNKGEPDILYPDAKYMLKIGHEKVIQGHTVNAAEAQPVYVRDTVSWKKLPGR